MAYDKVVDSAALDAGLLQIANAIREKAGIEDSVEFPDGFAELIGAISGGDGMFYTEITPAQTVTSLTPSTYLTVEHGLGYVPKIILVIKRDSTDGWAAGGLISAMSIVWDNEDGTFGRASNVVFSKDAKSGGTMSQYFYTGTSIFIQFNSDSVESVYCTSGTSSIVSEINDASMRICVIQGYAGVLMEAGKTYIVIAGGKIA